jgi:hypothetical protein
MAPTKKVHSALFGINFSPKINLKQKNHNESCGFFKLLLPGSLHMRSG